MRRGPWGGYARAVLGLGLALAALGNPAWGQGFVVDRTVMPPRPSPRPMPTGYEIREVGIDAKVVDQVAEVRVAQTFHNPNSTTIEAEYLFPLPDGAAIQNLVLLVDGQELPGKLMGKDEARRIYEEIVRSKRDPALLEYVGRGLFRASVFPIPPGADRKVTLRYTQLCRRERDVVEFVYPLATQKHAGRPVGKLTLNVEIRGRDAIKSIYSPSDDVTIKRPNDREARVSLERQNVTPAGDFRLVSTLAEGAFGASVLSVKPSSGEDGYFLLLASPKVEPDPDSKPLPKTVVFVLDRSGSMAGKKIEQAKNALRFVLDNLHEDGTFNIIAYDDRVESFRPELQRFDSRTRADAANFVDNIREGGSTNIDEALKAAMAQVSDDSRPTYILFLTDGLPTAGAVAELEISKNCRAANKVRARVFSFGVGYDVNARLLDRLGSENGGTSEYVRPDENIEAHVAAFYGKMTRPALASLSIEMPGTDVNRTYPRDLPDLFEGGQLVWAGRYTKPGKTTVRLSGKVGRDRRTYEFPAELADTGAASGRDYVETLWAVRRVGAIIDQIDLSGPNKELIDELLALSTKYGLLTPYTSFLADDRTQLHASGANFGRARTELEALNQVSGASGTMQRGMKQSYLKADRLDLAMQAQGQGQGAMGGMSGMMAGMGSMAPVAATPAMAQAASNSYGGYGMMGPGTPATAAPGRLAQASGNANSVPTLAKTPGMMGSSATSHAALANPSSPDAAKAGPAVRRVGSKTFFRKANRWVDSEVKPEAEAKAIKVEQFSDPYFALSRDHGPERNQYLSFDEPVTVLLDGQVYQIDPPAAR